MASATLKTTRRKIKGRASPTEQAGNDPTPPSAVDVLMAEMLAELDRILDETARIIDRVQRAA